MGRAASPESGTVPDRTETPRGEARLSRLAPRRGQRTERSKEPARCHPSEDTRRYHPARMPLEPAPGPLSGLLIVDCSTVLAGPYCTMLLGDLGADVKRSNRPTATPRGLGSALGRVRSQRTGTAAYYLAINRNKRSLRLDLKTQDGAEVLGRLLGRGDVVVENFRVGGFERLGFDDEVFAAA